MDGSQWIPIQRKEYYEIVKSNIKKKPGEKQALNYTVFTKKWMSIFKSEWANVTDSHSVFSYRGWFVTRNRIRLTDASGENRGSMNPPPPPPPPQ
jgi:hypothetical protein